MQISRIIPFLILVFLVSCMPQQPDLAGLKKTIEEFDATSMDAMMNGTTDEVMKFYADDAMSMPPNMATFNGKQAIESWMKQMAQSGIKMTSVKFGTTEVNAAGKIGYQVGTYDMAMEVPGMGTMNDVGKYISIWHQQEDGSWKIHAEMWNSNNPVPGMDMEMGSKEQKGSKKK